jgi:hypothetical protein
MVCYAKRDYKLLGFEKSRANDKMYAAILKEKSTGRERIVNFGSKSYENYGDKTGLNLYPHLIHGDSKRRASYHARHKNNVHDECYSPAYFSYYYLW